MNKDDDFCPYTGNEHKYFIFKTVELFEHPKTSEPIKEIYYMGEPMFIKKEYAILGCNCGSVIRKEVINQ